MKVKLIFILLHLLLAGSHYVFGQRSLDKIINGLSNDSLRYEVLLVGTAELKNDNRILLPKTLTAVQSVDVRRLVAKYKKKQLIKRLCAVLSDTGKDWYANILLYTITERDATPLIGIEGRPDWIRYNQSMDMEYWNNFMKK